MCQKCRDLVSAMDRGDVPGVVRVLLEQEKQDAAKDDRPLMERAQDAYHKRLSEENKELRDVNRQLEQQLMESSKTVLRLNNEKQVAEAFALQVGRKNQVY